MFKLLAIGASLLGAGLVVTLTGGILSGEGFSLGTGAEYLPVTHDYSTTGIDTITFDGENRRVVVTPSETADITLSYFDSTDDYLVISEVGGILSITNEVHWYSHMFMNFGMMNFGASNTVALGIPTGYNFTINLSTSNGTLSVSDLPTVAVLDLSTSNGVINIENVGGLSSLDATTSNGVINVTNVQSSGAIDLGSSNGNVNLTNVEAPTIDASTSNGVINITDVQCAEEINLDSSVGNINLTNVQAPTIDANTTAGRVHGLDITASDVTFETSTGNVTLEIHGLLSEYNVRLSTLIGKLHIDDHEVSQNAYNTSLPDKLDLSTTNGSVYLSFI